MEEQSCAELKKETFYYIYFDWIGGYKKQLGKFSNYEIYPEFNIALFNNARDINLNMRTHRSSGRNSYIIEDTIFYKIKKDELIIRQILRQKKFDEYFLDYLLKNIFSYLIG